MAIVAHVFAVLSWLIALVWLLQAIQALRGMPRVPDLNQIDTANLPQLPLTSTHHLAVIVPACNEEEHIRATLLSLLSSTGIGLQIIAVDDRSTDRTGQIMDEVATQVRDNSPHSIPHSILVLHNRELPSGWLGKPHALHLAAQHATAPWLLFTDGDVLFAPHALASALRYVAGAQIDHLVLLPTLTGSGVFERAMLALVQSLSHWFTHMWKVADPNAKDFIGVGGFNMVRTPVFEQLGGFSRLRMEVIEDMALGWIAKRGGCRSAAVLGLGLVNIAWIKGPLGIVQNIEKNGFAAFRYRTVVCLAACGSLLIEAALPLAAIFLGGWTLAGCALMYIAIALLYHANRRMNAVSPWHALLFAPSAIILAYAFFRSMALTLKNNGVTWRGTHYPLPELRANATHLKW